MPNRSRRVHAAAAIALFLAASCPVALLVASGKAPQEPSPAIPAIGHVKLTEVHAEHWYCAPTAVLLSAAGSGDNQFALEVRLGADHFTLSSTGGDMSCEVPGTARASGYCRFTVGGGQARTTVTCPGRGLRAARADKLLQVTAEQCRAAALGCDLVANLEITVVLQ